MKNRMNSGLWLGLMSVCFTLGLAIDAMDAGTPRTPKTHLTGETVNRKMDFKTGRFRRAYRLHISATYDPERPAPLVIAIHGASSRPALIEKRTGFNALADREGFLVLYPKGIGLGPLLRHWNAGHCCARAAAKRWDDVAFILAAIEDVAASHAVDRSRIYMTGFSNGAMLTYTFAAMHSEVLAAAAPVAGSIGGRPDANSPMWMPPEPAVAVPMIVFHGKADLHIPYDGGRSPLNRGPREYVSVRQSVSFWVTHNGCLATGEQRSLDDPRIVVETWRDPAGHPMVQLYSLAEWGHDWPGPLFTDHFPAEHPFQGFDAAELIWAFFETHRRSPSD